MPQKETLDRAAYTCMLVSYRRLPPQFQFSLSGVTLVYCISMDNSSFNFVADNRGLAMSTLPLYSTVYYRKFCDLKVHKREISQRFDFEFFTVSF
jgi:hypothetical protein